MVSFKKVVCGGFVLGVLGYAGWKFALGSNPLRSADNRTQEQLSVTRSQVSQAHPALRGSNVENAGYPRPEEEEQAGSQHDVQERVSPPEDVVLSSDVDGETAQQAPEKGEQQQQHRQLGGEDGPEENDDETSGGDSSSTCSLSSDDLESVAEEEPVSVSGEEQEALERCLNEVSSWSESFRDILNIIDTTGLGPISYKTLCDAAVAQHGSALKSVNVDRLPSDPQVYASICRAAVTHIGSSLHHVNIDRLPSDPQVYASICRAAVTQYGSSLHYVNIGRLPSDPQVYASICRAAVTQWGYVLEDVDVARLPSDPQVYASICRAAVTQYGRALEDVDEERLQSIAGAYEELRQIARA